MFGVDREGRRVDSFSGPNGCTAGGGAGRGFVGACADGWRRSPWHGRAEGDCTGGQGRAIQRKTASYLDARRPSRRSFESNALKISISGGRVSEFGTVRPRVQIPGPRPISELSFTRGKSFRPGVCPHPRILPFARSGEHLTCLVLIEREGTPNRSCVSKFSRPSLRARLSRDAVRTTDGTASLISPLSQLNPR
jgi:hypothetical protein